MLPGALVAVVAGIALNELFKGTSLEIAKEHLVTLPVPQSAEDFKNLVTFPDFTGFMNPKVWILGATIAIVASIETLLCIEASDRMDIQKNYRYQPRIKSSRYWKFDFCFYWRLTYDICSSKIFCQC
jgi:MFS superfamily sulfate permease-like transporter